MQPEIVFCARGNCPGPYPVTGPGGTTAGRMFEDMPVRRRPGIGRATLLNLSGLAVPVLVQVVTVPLYIKAIGPGRYGAMALIWLLLGYFGAFDLGFGRALASRMAVLRGAPAPRRAGLFWTGAGLSVAAGAAGGVLLYVVAFWLFGDVFSLPLGLLVEIRACVPFIALALPLVTGISALSGALQGCEAFGPLNLAQVTGNVLVQLLPLLAAILLSPSLPCLVLAAIAGRGVTAVMLAIFCRAHVPARGVPRLAAAEIPSLLSFGGWVTLTGLISPLLTVFDRFVIGAVGGMAAVTAYTVPFNLVMRLAALPSSLQNALFPRFAASDAVQAQALQARAVKIIAAAATPLLLAAMLTMKPLLVFWLGRPLALSAAPVGHILLAGLWANTLAFIPFGFLQSRGRPDLPAKFHVAELLFYAPLLLVLTHRSGVAGAAAAWDIRAASDALLLFAAVRLLPALLSCWFGLALVLAAFAWVAAGIDSLPLYWAVAAGLLGLGTIWAASILPDDVKAKVSLRLWRVVPAPVPS
jgi:O-antigen/teichoic acid export membrane protein